MEIPPLMLMWLIIVLTVSTLLTCYLGWRLINPAPLTRKWKFVGWSLVAMLLFGQWLIRFLGRGALEGELVTLVQWAGYVFLGMVSLFGIPMLARDFPILVKRLVAVLGTAFGQRSRRPYFIKPDRARRRFLLNASNAAILTATMPLTGYGIFEARRKPSVIHNDLPVPDLPQGLDGFTIAQITDTHIGPTLRGDWLQGVVEEVNALSPDMIVHTGDMVDGSVASLNGAVAPLSELKAPYGSWFCTGNHEYYSGVIPWLRKVRELGMTPLNNEHRLIDTGQGRILLGGVTDIRGGSILPAHQSSPTAAMANAPAHDISILLAHQPRSVFEASKAGFDIQLSGHTHGGQYFPYTLAIHLFQPYVRGLHLHENTLLYVSMGTGYWGPPVRLGTEPEITLHTLRRA